MASNLILAHLQLVGDTFTSTGAGDVGKAPLLNSSGKLDPSFFTGDAGLGTVTSVEDDTGLFEITDPSTTATITLLHTINEDNGLVQLTSDGKYPALDGSLITNLVSAIWAFQSGVCFSASVGINYRVVAKNSGALFIWLPEAPADGAQVTFMDDGTAAGGSNWGPSNPIQLYSQGDDHINNDSGSFVCEIPGSVLVCVYNAGQQMWAVQVYPGVVMSSGTSPMMTFDSGSIVSDGSGNLTLAGDIYATSGDKWADVNNRIIYDQFNEAAISTMSDTWNTDSTTTLISDPDSGYVAINGQLFVRNALQIQPFGDSTTSCLNLDGTFSFVSGAITSDTSGNLLLGGGGLAIHNPSADLYVRLEQKSNDESTWSWNVDGNNSDHIDNSANAAYKLSTDNNRFELQTMLAGANDWSTQIAAFGYTVATDNFYTHGKITAGTYQITEGTGLYYPSGNIMANSSGNLFYINGTALADSSSDLYYGNGSMLADSSGNLYLTLSGGLYDSDSSLGSGGQVLTSNGSSAVWSSLANTMYFDSGNITSDGSGTLDVIGSINIGAPPPAQYAPLVVSYDSSMGPGVVIYDPNTLGGILIGDDFTTGTVKFQGTYVGVDANLDISLQAGGGNVLIGTNVDDSSGNILQITGNIGLTTAGNGIQIKGGRTLTVVTLAAGTYVVSDSSLAAGDHIFLAIDTPDATNAGPPYVASRTNGTGFTISSTNSSDTSTVAYMIVHQN